MFTILVVEDNPPLRNVIKLVLDERGYNVMTASNGAEALRSLERVKPDLIVTDLVVPKFHGFDLIIQINSQWPSIPIICISGHLTESDGAHLLNGMAHFISKPFEITSLVEKVDFLLLGPPDSLRH